jgi:phosphoglycolate phosphatase-like HAD superfamily hydrolase
MSLWTVLVLLLLVTSASAGDDPLPSWNDGAAKRAIVTFVSEVTRDASPNFVPVSERVATFDNDGTLWSEQPIYFQFAFAVYRIKTMAPQHPEWKTQQPFKAVLEGDMKALEATGQKGVLELLMATHTGMTTDGFNSAVADWVENARHPRFNRRYTDLVFQPMIELMEFLRNTGFKTFIVSGGGVEFMRAFTERIYGIPPEQVVGSSGALEFAMRDGKPVLVKTPKVFFIDDHAGKPVGIEQYRAAAHIRLRQLRR